MDHTGGVKRIVFKALKDSKLQQLFLFIMQLNPLFVWLLKVFFVSL